MKPKTMNVGKLQEQLKELLKKLYIADAQEEKVYAEYESSDFNNADLEKTWDEWYKKSFEAHEELVNWLVSNGGGRIDKKTARAMIREKRKLLEALAGF